MKTTIVAGTSWTRADGERALEPSVLLPVPLEAAWEAFTTDAGFRRWGAPAAWIGLRLGGEFEPRARRAGQHTLEQRLKALSPSQR